MEGVQTKIKFCGLMRESDILAANALLPDYIGFVFAPKSRRYVTPDLARHLKSALDSCIRTVGVFVNEPTENITSLLQAGIIDIAQLHGQEDEAYISRLRTLTDKPIIQAFRIDQKSDVAKAQKSIADYILLDSGNGGTGTAFDWTLLKEIDRSYFLAGGLHSGNVADAIGNLKPFAVDVSSGIESEHKKDIQKMKAFIAAVRSAESRKEEIL